jgi:4-amino-4-deoxy-L-arabinose transferase-like glycosyltransferase
VSAITGLRRRDALLVVATALAVRLAVVAFGAARFPPADDGTFYHVVASRIARGLGYTWLWADGAVTYAAHYPVGYPALVSGGYALFGAHPGVAMVVNALFGTLAAFAVQSLVARSAPRSAALAAGLLVALEPALVLYTPALMTEGVSGALLVIAAAIAAGDRPERLAARCLVAGLVLGIAVLVRPELVLLCPVVGLVAARGRGSKQAVFGIAIVVGASLAVCAPWTARNCARLERCALVSVNGGWNLYIGSSPVGEGGWAPLERIGVPEECRTVFGEADKDACFGRAGLRVIASSPADWILLVPRKLAATFDYGTAAAHYLSASNPALVGEGAKTMIGALELLGQRVLLLLGLLAVARAEGPRPRARLVVAALSGAAALLPFAWVGWVGLVTGALLLGRALLLSPPTLVCAAVVLMTAGVHAVFFGASRYTLVCLPSLAALAGMAFSRPLGWRAWFDSRGRVAR